MGVNDAREQLEVAIEEVGRLEREVATLRAEKDSPHADAKYWAEWQMERAEVRRLRRLAHMCNSEIHSLHDASAEFANALTLHKDKIDVLTSERDAAIAAVARVRALRRISLGMGNEIFDARSVIEALAEQHATALAEQSKRFTETPIQDDAGEADE